MITIRSLIRATALPALAVAMVALTIGASKPALADVTFSFGTAPFKTASFDHRHRSFGKRHHFGRYDSGKVLTGYLARCQKVRRIRFVEYGRRALVSVLACRDAFGRFFFVPESRRVIRYY